jgi:hypothetical protein
MPTKLRLRATIALVCGAFAATGLTGLAGPSSATSGMPVPAASAGHLTSWGSPGPGNGIPESLADASVVAVDSSPYTNYNLAVRTDGTVAAWGDPTAAPMTLPQGLDHVVAVSAGPTYALALKDDGTITAWGDPSTGTLAIPFNLTRGGVTAIATTLSTALAVQDGQVTVWGTGAPAPPEMNNVVRVAAGDDYYLALRSDHTVVAWGTDTGGDTYVPADIQGHVVQIAAGGLTSAALLDNGTVRVWGNGMPMPTPPAGLSGEKVNEIDVNYSIVARTASGKVFTWGRSLPAVRTMSDLGGYPVAIAGGGAPYTVAILGKAYTTTRVTAPASTWGRPHKITATVTADGAPGTGTVTIKAGATTRTATLNSSGAAIITLPAQLRVGK